MHRRQLLSSVIGLWVPAAGGLGLGALASGASAASLFTEAEGTQALRAALERGANAAVGQLGRFDGFLGNEKVRIPLPSALQQAAPLLKTFGKGRQIEELQVAMNRAAEQAVPLALPLLRSAIRSMSVDDARHILSGGSTSVTQFFEGKTRDPLATQFLPLVSRVTDRLSLTKQYNELAGRAAKFGLVKGEQATVQQYVTGKALDGLFLVIGEQERQIRQDPIGTGSALLKKVFGSL